MPPGPGSAPASAAVFGGYAGVQGVQGLQSVPPEPLAVGTRTRIAARAPSSEQSMRAGYAGYAGCADAQSWRMHLRRETVVVNHQPYSSD